MLQTATIPGADRLIFSTQRAEYQHYDVFCLPPSDHDWSLRQLTDENEKRQRDFKLKLGTALAVQGIRVAYAPRVVAMSGAIIEQDDFPAEHSIELPSGVTLKRTALPSDGTFIGKNEAFVMSGGGCPVVIVSGRGICIVAHASRDSLLDRIRMLGTPDEKPREHFSLIDAIAAKVRARGFDPKDMTLRALLQVPSECFGHPMRPDLEPDWRTKRKYNVVMHGWVNDLFGRGIAVERDGISYLSIGKLIARQAALAGFEHILVDELPLPADGPYAHTRHPDQELKKLRNLAIVHRIS